MSENLGTIKIMEGRIITTKNDVKEVWSQGSGDPNTFILYKGVTYKLLSGKEPEKEEKKKYQEIEEDIENLEDFDELY